MSERKRLPNWSKWKSAKTVALWQAVALSMNIDPDKIRRGESGEFLEGAEFDRRLKQASAARQAGEF